MILQLHRVRQTFWDRHDFDLEICVLFVLIETARSLMARFDRAANDLSRQLKLRLALQNRPASIGLQSAKADFVAVAATPVARWVALP
jgi:hypothetical protein